MKYLMVVFCVALLSTGCRSTSDRKFGASANGPDPTGTGFIWTSNGVQQLAGQMLMNDLACDAGAPGFCSVIQISGDGGTNDLGGSGIISMIPHESIVASGSTHPVRGISKAIATTNATPTVLGTFTPASITSVGNNTLDKWTLSVEGVLTTFTAGDAGLVDYYEADFVFVDTAASDGGVAINPASVGGDAGTNVLRSSCSGTGCTWFSIITVSAGVITISVVGGTSQNINWNSALQLQEQH